MIETAAAIFLLLGLWTPAAGTVVAITAAWRLVTGASEPWTSGVVALLGASLAMIGPGAWSIDARLFGRKHIDPGE